MYYDSSFELLEIIVTGFFIFKFIIGAFFCVYGYKWHRGLISTTAFYIGLFIGVLIDYILLNIMSESNPYYMYESTQNTLIMGLLVVVFAGGFLSRLSYKNLRFNKFMVGFLVGLKSTVLLYTLTLHLNIQG